MPRDSLENHYRGRARQIINTQVAGVENSMELENQAGEISDEKSEALIEKLIIDDCVDWASQ